MKDQPGIEQKFEASFEACEALQEFAEAHRPGPVSHEASLIVAGTIARSAAAFKCIIKLCRMGYGDQASMLNRSFFEDMISAHWATLLGHDRLSTLADTALGSIWIAGAGTRTPPLPWLARARPAPDEDASCEERCAEERRRPERQPREGQLTSCDAGSERA